LLDTLRRTTLTVRTRPTSFAPNPRSADADRRRLAGPDDWRQSRESPKEDSMRRKAVWVAMFGISLVGATAYVATVLATPASGFVGTTVAVGRFDDIDVMNNVLVNSLDESGHPRKHPWLSLQKTKGSSDLYIQNNVWAPGGSSGWHTHPGHSLIIVTAGTVTAYEGDDPSCAPHVYTAGMGFVDPGGGHVHVLRNEGLVEARTMTVQLIPAGATRRIDADAPAGCSF
jgi:hypothetical protein